MDNLLPRVSKAATSARVNESFFRNWHVEKANPKTAIISDYLASEFTPDPEEIKRYRENKLAKPEPNYVPPEELRSLGPSPLDAVARGLPEPPGPVVLRASNIFTLDKSIYRPPVIEKIEDLIVCTECRLPTPIDLFVQRSNSIRSTTLQPKQLCLRSLTGASMATNSSSDSPNCFYVMLTTAKRATVVSTVRQQIKEFSFYTDSKIGLEVEMSYSRLVVSKVLPDSQSESMTLQMDGAEIIAVNGQRVVDLEEFQDAMAAAKQLPAVRLLMAAYRGGRGKADDAFLFDLQKSQGMKSVLSNLFGGRGDDGDRVGTASTDDEQSVRSHETADSKRSHRSARSQRSQRSQPSRDDGSAHDSDQHSADHKDSGSVASRNSKAENKSPSRRPRHRRTHSADSDEEGEDGKDDSDEEERAGGGRRLSRQHSQRSQSSRRLSRGSGSWQSTTSAEERRSRDNGIIEEEVGEEGSLLAGKKVPTVTDLHAQTPPPKSPPAAAESKSQKSDWNYLTATDAEPASVVPFVTLVCMPSLLRSSRRWGRPAAYFQCTNFSSSLSLEVNWTDEDGCLVTRANVAAGQTHFELACDEHVWTLAAKPSTGGGGGGGGKSKTVTSGASIASMSTGSVGHNVGYDNDRPVPFLILRPSSAGLVEGRCVTLMWYPFSSLSVTRTVYPQSKRSLAEEKEEKIQPCIHVQLMDVPRSRGGPVGEGATNEQLGKLIRKPLTKTRVLNRWRKGGKGNPGPRLPPYTSG